MNHTEYIAKYEKLDSEYRDLKFDRYMTMLNHPASKHPAESDNWIDYARDNGFTFSNLKLPRKGDELLYEMVHGNFDEYEPFMDIWKEFMMCKKCGVTWTLLIRLNGDYDVYNETGSKVIDPEKDENYYMKYYKLPKYINTVLDLMKILDVIEMSKHSEGE